MKRMRMYNRTIICNFNKNKTENETTIANEHQHRNGSVSFGLNKRFLISFPCESKNKIRRKLKSQKEKCEYVVSCMYNTYSQKPMKQKKEEEKR